MPFPRLAAVALFALVLAGCSADARRPPGPLRVVATTSTLASLARGAAGRSADVRSLVPVGVSPEDYQPTPQDIAALHDADVLIENGAGLEGWLAATLHNAGNPRLRVVVCTDGLPVVDENPHLWVDPELARGYVGRIADALVAADPAHASDYRRSAKAYDGELAALVARTRAKLASIPPARRVMIIFHNAFFYYDRRFGLREIAAVEPIVGAEPNPAHISDVVELAKRYRAPAIFAEHEFNPRLAETIAASAGGLRVAYLYDDSLGTTSNVASYVGMIDTDTDTIVSALR